MGRPFIAALFLIPAFYESESNGKFTISWDSSIFSLPMVIAEGNSFFTDEGIELEFVAIRDERRSLRKRHAGEPTFCRGSAPHIVTTLDHEKACNVAGIGYVDNAFKFAADRRASIAGSSDLIGSVP